MSVLNTILKKNKELVISSFENSTERLKELKDKDLEFLKLYLQTEDSTLGSVFGSLLQLDNYSNYYRNIYDDEEYFLDKLDFFNFFLHHEILDDGDPCIIYKHHITVFIDDKEPEKFITINSDIGKFWAVYERPIKDSKYWQPVILRSYEWFAIKWNEKYKEWPKLKHPYSEDMIEIINEHISKKKSLDKFTRKYDPEMYPKTTLTPNQKLGRKLIKELGI